MTPWTAAYQAPPSMGFSRQEYWSRVPLPSPNYESWENTNILSKTTQFSRLSQSTHAIPSQHARFRRAIQGEPEASAFFPLETIHVGLPLWVPRKEQDPEKKGEKHSPTDTASASVSGCAWPFLNHISFSAFIFLSPVQLWGKHNLLPLWVVGEMN